jgi:hypothetical protein
MFGNENLKRIDRRVKAGNVSRFLEELTDMSKEPMKVIFHVDLGGTEKKNYSGCIENDRIIV